MRAELMTEIKEFLAFSVAVLLFLVALFGAVAVLGAAFDQRPGRCARWGAALDRQTKWDDDLRECFVLCPHGWEKSDHSCAPARDR